MGRIGGLYAAYGPNMDPGLMLERCPHSPFAGAGWAEGWSLTFGGPSAMADIVRFRVSTSDEDVLAWAYVLDDYEGGLPSVRYLELLADAAARAGAPDDYVTRMRSRPAV